MAEVQSSAFAHQISVSARIDAPAAAIWSRLTDAAGFPAWNSTVSRVGGDIAPGQRLAIEVPAAPGRTFRPTVTEWEPGRRMVWSDGLWPMFRGRRTFTLEAEAEGTRFTMVERFEGLMLPLIRGSLPDFAPIFDRYAEDLRRACEGAA